MNRQTSRLFDDLGEALLEELFEAAEQIGGKYQDAGTKQKVDEICQSFTGDSSTDQPLYKEGLRLLGVASEGDTGI